ncbi:TPA: NAD(P)H-dependent oxidoreductase [Serratia marcescens]
MKTLVVVTHPDMANSVVNKRWLEELRRYPALYTVHELHQAYPDWQIDVAKEQQLIVQQLKPPLAVPGFEMTMLWHERTHRDPAHRWLREHIVRSV